MLPRDGVVLVPSTRAEASPARRRRLGVVLVAAALLAGAGGGVASARPYPGPAGVVDVRGPLEARYLQLGGPPGLLGAPVTGEHPTPDRIGRYHHFERGSVYWSPSTGAHEVYGAIRQKWAELRWESGHLGYPVTGELPAGGGSGRASHFQGGSVYWTPATGAREVRGAIRDRWRALRGELGHLGYPVSDELPLPDRRGRVSHFQGGSIYWNPATGAHEVRGALRQAWLARGAERGPFGYPVSDEYGVPGGQESDFQGGYLRWDAATGAVREGRGQVLAPGVAHRRIDNPAGPFSSRVLTVDPSGPATLDVALAQDRLPGFETTSSMARRHHALAAVNGDFALPSGRPVHLYAEDGALLQAPALVENALATPGHGVATFLGRPAPAMSVQDVTTGRSAPLARVNSGPPSRDELALVTPEAGALETPPRDACSARLTRRGTPGVDGSGATVQDYVVRHVACGEDATAFAAAQGYAVLSAPAGGEYSDFVRQLTTSTRLRLSWSLGWARVMDASGGNAVLLEDGRLTSQVYGTGSFFARHPRTAVGSTASGQLLLVTVDGRQPGYSVGMTHVELAEHLRSLGAVRAMLLDGGGSTTMTVRGQVTNRPSDGSERPAATALLILDRPDVLPPEAWRGAASAADTDVVGERQLADPGSTGGWARAQRQAGLPLPEELDAVLR